MGGEALKLQLGLPRPTRWDLITMAAAAVGVVLAGLNWHLSQTRPGGAGVFTPLFALVQLGVCLGSLMLLGKTAKEGTIWGNLAAVAGMFIGMGGMLLAAALWAAA
jgi:hypothetical protein